MSVGASDGMPQWPEYCVCHRSSEGDSPIRHHTDGLADMSGRGHTVTHRWEEGGGGVDATGTTWFGYTDPVLHYHSSCGAIPRTADRKLKGGGGGQCSVGDPSRYTYM